MNVEAVRLKANSYLVRAGLAKEGDWHIFEDHADIVVSQKQFFKNYKPSGLDAKGRLTKLRYDNKIYNDG